MRPWNPLSTGRDGAPITGRVPVRLVVLGGTLTGTQAAAVQLFFTACCEEHRLSVAPGFSRRRILHDGTRVKVTILGGSASVVAIAQQSAVGGIGMRFVGWDGAMIPGLSAGGESNYYLAYLPKPSGPWVVERRSALVGGQHVWVSADRKRWLATAYSGPDLRASAHYKNNTVFSGVAPAASYAPAVRASRRGAARADVAMPVSFLKIAGGRLELLQPGDDGAYLPVDSVAVGDGSGAIRIIGASGERAMVAEVGATIKAYAVALSGDLSVGAPQSVPQADPVGSSSGEIKFSGYKKMTQHPAPPAQGYLPDWSIAPDLGSITLTSEGQQISAFQGRIAEAKATLKAAADARGDRWSAAFVYDTAWHYAWPYTAGFEQPPRHYTSITVGLWGLTVEYTALSAKETTIDSALSTYTEECSSESRVSDTPWVGMGHGGEMVYVGRDTETTTTIDGTTQFSMASPTVSKTTKVAVKTTWRLPGGDITTNSVTEEEYTESTVVPYPAMFPVAGSVSVACTAARDSLTLLHYDPDTRCAVFLREAITGSGSAAWSKMSSRTVNGAPVARSTASTPLGTFEYVNSAEPEYTSSATATMSVLVYLAGALNYEEQLATGPGYVSPVMYEPMAYSDMRFDFMPGGPRPDADYWPAQTVVYGPGVPTTYITPLEDRVIFGSEPYLEDVFPEDYEGGGGVTTVIRPAETYTQLQAAVSTSQIEREHHIDRSAQLTGVSPTAYPAAAGISGHFAASVAVAKDARSGGLAVQISYSYDGFSTPKERSRVLLVSHASVTRIDDQLGLPPNGGEDRKLTTTFLATI